MKCITTLHLEFIHSPFGAILLKYKREKYSEYSSESPVPEMNRLHVCVYLLSSWQATLRLVILKLVVLQLVVVVLLLFLLLRVCILKQNRPQVTLINQN